MIQFDTILEALAVIGIPSLSSIALTIVGFIKFIKKCKELRNKNEDLKDELVKPEDIVKTQMAYNRELMAKINHINYVVRDVDEIFSENQSVKEDK